MDHDDPEAAENGRQPAAPAAGISTMIQQFKRTVSKAVGYPVWQRGCYDHII